MNEERIVQSLNQYQGNEETLNETVKVLSEELGPEWVNDVFEKLGGLPVELKEKLNHVFNYYAALMAWQETQTYLEQKEPLDASVNERLPILKHWLDFFGDPGIDLYNQLEKKISELPEDKPDSEGESDEKNGEKEEQTEKEDISESIQQPEEERSLEEIKEDDESKVSPKENTEETSKEEGTETEIPEEKKTKEFPYDTQSPEFFAVQKAKKEIELLDGVQSWLSARCLQLNNMEVFAYPYYGFAVDLMRQVSKDIQAVLELGDKSVVANLYPGGEEAITRKKQAVDADIETAVQNCESATTALIDENIDMEKVRKTLGDLDENPEPEYLGPAPDGFELLDDSEGSLDENAVKEKYQELEKEALAETEDAEKNILEKKASQTSQNSVQRKLSFSLKPKK